MLRSNTLVNYPNTFNRAKKVMLSLSSSNYMLDHCLSRLHCRFLENCFLVIQSVRWSVQGRQIAVSADAHMVFHPSGSVIQRFDILEGSLHALLRGHMDTVNACCYNPTNQVGYLHSLLSKCPLGYHTVPFGGLFLSYCDSAVHAPGKPRHKACYPILCLWAGTLHWIK